MDTAPSMEALDTEGHERCGPLEDNVIDAIQSRLAELPVGMATPTMPGMPADRVVADPEYQDLSDDLSQARAHAEHAQVTTGAGEPPTCSTCHESMPCSTTRQLAKVYL